MANWYLWTSGLVVSLCTFLFGYDTAINGAKDMSGFRAQFNLSSPSAVNTSNCSSVATEDVETSAILGALVSMLSVGAVLGALCGGPLSDAAGRKVALIVGVAIYTVGGVVQTAAFFLWMMFVGRILTGVAIGIIVPTVPVYIAEISPKDMRGRLISLTGVVGSVAMLTAAVVNSIMDRYAPGFGWRVVLGLQLLAGAILTTGLVFLPETPRWLAKKGRSEKALAVLRKVHKLEEKARAELKEIEESIVDTSTRDLLRLVCNFKMFKRLLLGSCLFIISRLCGITAFKYYSVTIFNKVGIDGFLSSLLVNFSFLFASILSSVILDKFGRKPLLLFGTLFMCFTMVLAATLILTLEDVNAAHYVVVVLICVFSACFMLTFSIITWVINSEIYPLKIRSVMVGLASLSWWIVSIFVSELIPVLLASPLQTAGTFYLFAVALIVAFFYVLFLIPETKGQSLEKMEAIFSKPWSERVDILYYLRCGCLFECCKKRGGYSVTPSTDTAKLEEEEEEVELQTEPATEALHSKDTDTLLQTEL